MGGKPGALILDEPTATLSHEETEILFEVVRKLRADGWAILYITHRLEEVRELGDCRAWMPLVERSGYSI